MTPGTRAKPVSAGGPQSLPLSDPAPVASSTNLAATARTQKKSVLANGEAPQAVKADIAQGTTHALGDDERLKTPPPG